MIATAQAGINGARTVARPIAQEVRRWRSGSGVSWTGRGPDGGSLVTHDDTVAVGPLGIYDLSRTAGIPPR